MAFGKVITDPARLIQRFLDTVGDGSGTRNANGDYSVTAEEFFFKNVTSEDGIVLNSMIVSIVDDSGFREERYGALGAALSNGIRIQVKDENDTIVNEFTSNEIIKTNGDWAKFCYDVDLKTWGGGNSILVARYTFGEAGTPLFLPFNYTFSIVLNDDFTGIIEHFFHIKGYRELD